MRILLVVYDNDSFLHWFPQGLGYIAAVYERQGCDVEIYSQDLGHSPDSHLTAYLDTHDFDMVGISVIAGYYQYRKLLGLSEAINRSKRRPFYVIGGYGPTPEPEFFLRKTGADAIVMGEGEITAVDLIAAMRGEKPWTDVAGIAYRDGDAIRINARRPLMADLGAVPWPAYHKFPMAYYRLLRMPHCDNADFLMPMMSGRGCTFKCTFCYRMDTGYRPRQVEDIVEEAKYLNRDFGINYFVFNDDLLMTSVSFTEAVAKALIASGLDIKWSCNGRLNYCTPDLLKLMRQSGCVFINFGIEAMDNDVLRLMKKGLRTDQVIKGVEATVAAGISPGLNILFGNLGDTAETLRKAVDFLVRYDDFSQVRTIRPVTPYPGSPLYYHALENGLMADVEEFYEKRHLNSDLLAVNFTELSDAAFYDCLHEANRILLENHQRHAHRRMLDQLDALYKRHDPTGFRGFR